MLKSEERTSLTFVDAKQWPELRQGTLRISGKSWTDEEKDTIQHNANIEPNN